ncbi:MAG: hypothetical protein L6R39_000335 [Caloplaca ligustica]|nr:MAG: hypothetical protein L6R39_000335 [Caloplaca ligustica]
MAANQSNSTPTTLNVTAISAKDGASTIECWQLAAPFKTSAEAGVSGAAIAQLGKAGSASYVVLPPKFNGGLHNAPAVQYVVFIAGEAVVTTPETQQAAIIKGGADGLIIAADTAAVSRLGHNTQYPTGQQTIAIQIPTADGTVPEHTVLYSGPCRKEDSP